MQRGQGTGPSLLVALALLGLLCTLRHRLLLALCQGPRAAANLGLPVSGCAAVLRARPGAGHGHKWCCALRTLAAASRSSPPPKFSASLRSAASCPGRPLQQAAALFPWLHGAGPATGYTAGRHAYRGHALDKGAEPDGGQHGRGSAQRRTRRPTSWPLARRRRPPAASLPAV